MTVSKTTLGKIAQDMENWPADLVAAWGPAYKEQATLIAAFCDSVTAELQKENARLREALQFIHDTFKKDEDDGYSSRDRQFAIDITKAALAGWHSQDAKPSKGGAVQKELSKEKAK